ncbi:hypothetical protein [Amantichitinum ursilacus]|uniref:Uncharacterized protein n=1 Tax=Amantichitinum ursilacus TaxID=857265 RepID=A0A0N0GND9_9NEIS|nr:hypothetical protein [Amantichitinum ursilacus]KPC52493.1 hypothetical protein WG78_11630 [Amantichitinum ursilacus]
MFARTLPLLLLLALAGPAYAAPTLDDAQVKALKYTQRLLVLEQNARFVLLENLADPADHDKACAWKNVSNQKAYVEIQAQYFTRIAKPSSGYLRSLKPLQQQLAAARAQFAATPIDVVSDAKPDLCLDVDLIYLDV